MYDILFICTNCGAHLSADENDVGATFPCPECANDLTIPVGDILFECPKCGKDLLASRTAAQQLFHCPSCNRPIVVPAIGKTVPVSEKTKPIPPLPNIAPLATPQKPAANPASQKVSSSADDRRFMSTWGDYLAEAGLANDKTPAPPSST